LLPRPALAKIGGMATQLDVYRDWLGVQEAERPLTHYQLLRLRKFEDDTGKIREHYRKMNAHVRKFAAGDFAKQSQELLNELAKAMLCLTDVQRKAEYDASLGRTIAGQDGKRRSLEEILLHRNIIDQERLQKARSYSNAVGVEMRDALIQQKIASAEVIMPVYAESIGLSFLDLAEFDIDPLLAARVPAYIARQQSLAPVMIDNNQLLVAAAHLLEPQVEEELRLRVGLSIRTVLCTPAAIHDVVNRFYTKEAAAVELAAGAAAKPVDKSKAGKKSKAERRADAPLTADELIERNTMRRNATIIGFNFSVILVSLLLQATSLSNWTVMLIAVVVAAITASVAWIVSPKFL
jgi:hypothetical protein